MKKKRTLFRWGDAVIFGLLLFTSLASVLYPKMLSKKNQTRTVSVRTAQENTFYPLSEDAEIRLSGGGYHLTLVIRDGQVSVEHSDCPDHFCEKTAPISAVGQSIVCLPAEIVITVTGGDANADIILG